MRCRNCDKQIYLLACEYIHYYGTAYCKPDDVIAFRGAHLTYAKAEPPSLSRNDSGYKNNPGFKL